MDLSIICDLLTGGQHTRLLGRINLLIAQRDEIEKKRSETMTLLVKAQQDLALCGGNKTDLLNTITSLTTANEKLIVSIMPLNLKIAELSQRIMELSGRDNNSLISATLQTTLDSYYTKYPEANITYSGRYFGANINSFYEQDIKTWVLEGQNDFMLLKKLRDAHAFVSEILPEVNGDFHKACDIAIIRVANAIQCNYVYDMPNYGVNEYWAYPTETLIKNKGDCDDWSALRYAAFRMAGIPAQMLRVVCGMTYGNEGHSTNYYFASDLKWRHVNSTSNFNATDNLFSVTKQNWDSSDNYGISSVWFSFNEDKSWHQLATSAKKELKKSTNKLISKIKIYPKGGSE